MRIRKDMAFAQFWLYFEVLQKELNNFCVLQIFQKKLYGIRPSITRNFRKSIYEWIGWMVYISSVEGQAWPMAASTSLRQKEPVCRRDCEDDETLHHAGEIDHLSQNMRGGIKRCWVGSFIIDFFNGASYLPRWPKGCRALNFQRYCGIWL